MNRIWRQLAIATNWPVLAAVLVLSSLGILTICAAAEYAPLEARADGKKQALFVTAGLLFMFAMQAINYQKIGRWAWAFYILSLALVVYTVLPGMPRRGLFSVPEINGARAWIDFGVMKLQPAELTKIAFIIVLARYLRFRSNFRTFTGLLQPFALAIVPLLLILKQPDLGTALVFIPALFAMLFVAGARGSHLVAIMAMGLAVLPLAWLSGDTAEGAPGLPVFRHLPTLIKNYQRKRVYAMFTSDPAIQRTFGFQQTWALTSFASGGLTGRGAMQIPVGRHVPEAHNDMIFALIGEQFGLLGSAVVLAAYLVLFAAGIEIASATREPFGKLVAVGMVSLLAGQAFLNLMVSVRLMPVTGITLPFVSYGGSSFLASSIAAGLLLNVGQNRPLVIAKDAFEFDA